MKKIKNQEDSFHLGLWSGTLITSGLFLIVVPLYIYLFGWDGGLIDAIVSSIIGTIMFSIGSTVYFKRGG